MKMNLLLVLACLGLHVQAQNLDTVPYFAVSGIPDAAIYLPAPPDTCSPLFIDDFSQWLWGKSMRSTARGERASWESLYSVERMCDIYGGLMGFELSQKKTPAIYRILSRGMKTSQQAVDRAKEKYMRVRPFARMGEQVWGAYDSDELRQNGSYPSGHTSLGWTTALMMMQVAPELQDTILRRGWEYGESRVIVGAHWQSDVDAARLAAAAAVVRVQASEAYQADLAAARKEFLKHYGKAQAVGYPNSLRILPAPIDTADRRYQGDVAAHWMAKADRATSRGQQAVTDAKKNIQDFLAQYALCLDLPLDTASAPAITAYLKYVRKQVRDEVRTVKSAKMRKRPFVQLEEGTLIPEEEASHRTDSSFPSSHAAQGWGLALAMVELTPDSMNAIMQRGFDYGYSRVIAGYHWYSDVQAARVLASYTLIRMQADPKFQELLLKARAEYAALRKR